MKLKTIIMATTLATSAVAYAQESASELMTPEKLWELKRIGNMAVSPDEHTLLYTVTQYSKAENKGTTTFRTCDLEGRAHQDKDCTKELKGSNPTYINEGRDFLFIDSEGRLCLSPVANLQLNEGQPAGVTPLPEDVEDYPVSPDERHIIIIRRVPQTASIEAKESDLPEATGMVINDLMYKHWDHYVTDIPHPFLYTFDGKALSKEATDILDGEPYECPMEPFGGAEQLSFSPDGKWIAYTCRKKTGRDYAISTDSDIYLYDIQERQTVKNLCKPEAYKEPVRDPLCSLEEQEANHQAQDCNMGYDQNPQFSPDGTKIAWLSMERDGYESDRQRLCVYYLETGKKEYVAESYMQKTRVFDHTVEEFLWAPDSYFLYFTSPVGGTVSLFRTDLDGNVQPFTKCQADFSLGAITKDGRKLYVKMHSMKRPDEIYTVLLQKPLRKIQVPHTGGAISTIEPLELLLQKLSAVNDDTYKTLAVGDVKERWVETVDGKKMLCWVVYPPHFDEPKKYPALLFCEGGPQSPVSQFWSYRWNFQIMAANGYVVIAPNRRGLPGFGMEWLEEISGDYTGLCMQDYLSAIDDLAKEEYIDKERLGAVGASFGGFSVYWLAGNHEGRFKAFIAHDGIYNTQQQYVETEEMWFPNWDMKCAPWMKAADGQMQKAFRESPHLYVDKWDTPILCIHGQRDFRIEYTQAESAFNAARMRGLDAQLLLFPNENHWVLKPQNGILWQRTFFRFLDKYLK